MKFRSLALILLVTAIGSAQTLKPPPKPVDQIQILALLIGGVPSQRVAMIVNQRGITFEPADDYLDTLKAAGADEVLVRALRTARRETTPAVEPAVAARQKQVQQYLARGQKLASQKLYRDAEAEYRAALQLDPANSYLHATLGSALGLQQKWDEATAEWRTVVRLRPDDTDAHYNLGVTLRGRGDLDGAIAEYREAIRLQTDNPWAHGLLGVALAEKGDLDAGISELQSAIRLKPDFAEVHQAMAEILTLKGDREGAISEYRMAIQLQPYNGGSHRGLGAVLAQIGDTGGAITELQRALQLDAGDHLAHYLLGVALLNKGDRESALSELRQAYMLAPQNATYKTKYEDVLSRGIPTGDTPIIGGRPAQPPSPGGVLFVAYRASGHQKYSSPEVFQSIADQLLLFLKSHGVRLVNDSIGRTVQTETTPSIYSLIQEAQRLGAGSLLLLTVDRPLTSWAKLELRCFDIAGKSLWVETSMGGSWYTLSSKKEIGKAVEQMERKVVPRLGQAGMPVRVDLSKSIEK